MPEIPWCCYLECSMEADVIIFATDGGVGDYTHSCGDHVVDMRDHINLGTGTTVFQL